MRDTKDFKALNGLVMKPKPSAEEERLAKMREQQKRQRKEKLYSSDSKSH